jgi:hypothetical protein
LRQNWLVFPFALSRLKVGGGRNLVTEGGISYRRIKLSYGLDDDSIKQVAADADGERLV